MEQLVRIVTDSSCDLPRRLVERFKIAVAPLTVHFGSAVYEDGELSVEEFWQKAAGPHHPRTSQPSVGKFEQLFEGLVAQGKQVLCLTITSKHSGTFNAAHLAAQRFGQAVRVFDSLSLSLGLGLQALTAAQAAQAGGSMQELLALLEDMRARMRLMIVLDTLENLRRGGRADGFIAVVDRMTRALNIKAVINVVEGQLRLLGAARSFQRGLRRVLNLVEGLGTPASPGSVSGCERRGQRCPPTPVWESSASWRCPSPRRSEVVTPSITGLSNESHPTGRKHPALCADEGRRCSLPAGLLEPPGYAPVP
jgi:DegV family protein with EDD domain